MKRLYEVQAITERFIDKRLRVNKPLQSLMSSEQYEAFKARMEAAIADQLTSVANALSEAHSVAITTLDLLDKFVETHMPPMTDYIGRDELFDYLKFCFVEGVRSQYIRSGYKTSAQKADFTFEGSFDFDLTNPSVIAALYDEADYMLRKSAIDDTTRQQLIDTIQTQKVDFNSTPAEIAKAITDTLDNISSTRATLIARTETARAMGSGNYNAMTKNGVKEKRWVTAGSNPCETCIQNEEDGLIPVGDQFSSGDMYEPAHPNDECYTEAGEIDLDAIDLWGGE